MKKNCVAPAKVNAVLEILRTKRPKNYKKLLEIYLANLKAQLRLEHALIEYSGRIDDSTVARLKEDLSKYYDRDIHIDLKENHKLIAGFRISVGDDVWDTSLSGRLDQISRAFNF